MNLFKSKFFGIEMIINYLLSLKHQVHKVVFQFKTI